MLDILRKQQATWIETRMLLKLMIVLLSISLALLMAEEFEGGKSTDFVLAMGKGRMIPGFEEGIIGIKRVNNLKLNTQHF